VLFLQKVSCADTNVGDAKVRGISGGEKKRLSLACELLASPSVIFADEPTTGKHAHVELLCTGLKFAYDIGHMHG
jgi:energy-coupling factor transporter ATP-binding protein EcfA2